VFVKQSKGILMKYSIVFSAVLMALALSACDKPTVVTPAAVVTVPVPGPAGPTGATGSTGEVAMKGFVQNIEGLAVKNDEFRRVLYTAKHLQLVVMALKPKEARKEVRKENKHARVRIALFRVSKRQEAHG
jgi:hypothetical protein